MAKLVAVEDIPKGARLVAVDDEQGVPFGKQVSDSLSSIPRQLGLTARAGIEGVGDLGDLLSSPFRVGLNAVMPNSKGDYFKPGSASHFADFIGLPTPETTTEKVANTGARFMLPGAAFIKGGQTLSKLPGAAGEVGGLLASNPAMQLESAGAAGSAGEYTKQTGGGPGAQFATSIAAGVAAPYAINMSANIPGLAMNAAKHFVESVAPGVVKQAESPQINVIINNALRDSGITLDQLPSSVSASIRNDVSSAMQSGDKLNGDALRRLVDYRLTGATPRNANLTLDPVAITQQKNLAKLGANSKDPDAQLLARAENENNTTLISGLNALGAGTRQDAIGAGGQVIDDLTRQINYSNWVIDNMYGAARNTEGRSAALDPSVFTNRANNLLDESLLGGKLPSDVRNLLNKTATGDMPLTVDVSEQFKTRIAALQRASNDPAERLALGHVRTALEETPLMSGEGLQAVNAFNAARRAYRGWMEVVDRTPALKAVIDGVEPDKFVNKFIIGNGDGSSVMSVSHLSNLVKDQPSSMTAIRGQIAAYIKDKALNGSSDEVGKISQSALNKAIDSIGDRKLMMFFNEEEINQIKAIGRVSSYEQVQPIGSAVNNSNTAGTAFAQLLDKLGNSPLLRKIPLGNQISEPAMNASVGIQSRQAANIPAGLIMPMKKRPMMLGISPAIGLLGPPTE